jgi:autotransporter passenger strand-loop-strand repeat protein
VSQSLKVLAMTRFTSPPDQNQLVLNSGDILNVNSQGRAVFTTINDGGVENVHRDGLDIGTTINKKMLTAMVWRSTRR